MPTKKNTIGTGHRRAYHKKTLCSTWDTRNDSSNVNAILHPDVATPRKCIHGVPTKPAQVGKGVYKKCCLGSNTCYCREKPIKPKCLSRPNKCLSLEAFRRNIKDRRDNLSRRSLRCLCEGDDASVDNVANITDSDLIKKYKELEKNSTSLRYTDQRKEYNLFREDQHEEYLNDIGEYEWAKENESHFSKETDEYGREKEHKSHLSKKREEYERAKNNESHLSKKREEYERAKNNESHLSKKREEYERAKNNESHLSKKREEYERAKNNESHLSKKKEEYERAKGNKSHLSKEKERNELVEERNDYNSEEEGNESISTLLGTIQANSKLGSSGFLTEGLNIEELKKFRDEHYFETHAVDYSDEDIPKHTCIHQFELDDRLLPAPINADVYGRSRCSICNQPMEGDRVQLSKSYFSDRSSKVSLENFSKCYRMGLVPRALSIGGDKSKIELKLSEKNINKFGLFLGKYRRPQYTNTYALRQQKMLC